MEKTIALTGVTGAMGGEVLLHLLRSSENLKVKCIIYEAERHLPAFVRKTLKKYSSRVYTFKGNIACYEDCVKLIEGCDYVFHCASLIPPKSDHNPQGTYLSNFIGTKNMVDAVLASGRQEEIGFVHIATVAMYGHRAYPHVWGRVGDPIISSDYDCYSLYKLKAERYVLESGLKKFVSLRQTAVLH
ncbi:MAG: NAD-dependent epimerase/dehydratase family protein, partial [Clostridia bacterium]|nr:NAD-dependent epimerase/dehydratase family protein [Clostridia bacterium]